MTEETLFAEALARSPEERSAFLDEACAGDSTLLQRVEQLLRSNEGAGSFLAQSAEEDFDATLDMSAAPANFPDIPVIDAPAVRSSAEDELDATLPLIPVPSESDGLKTTPGNQESNLSHLGADPDSLIPFIFGQRIAQGGMGAIIEADDCKFGRKIAVKVMLSENGLSTEKKIRLYVSERIPLTEKPSNGPEDRL